MTDYSSESKKSQPENENPENSWMPEQKTFEKKYPSRENEVVRKVSSLVQSLFPRLTTAKECLTFTIYSSILLHDSVLS